MNPDSLLTRIFIVDDHPLMRDSLTHLLQSEPGFMVAGSAEAVETALTALRANPPDLVLVDITLRDSSGLALLQELARWPRPVPAIVVSMHDEPSVIEAALRRGARGYVSKAEPTDVLLSAIRTVLQGGLVGPAHLCARLQTPADAPGKMELVAQLSAREHDVFTRIGRGQQPRQIAEELGLSVKTVQTFCARIKQKLNLDHVNALVAEAAEWLARQTPAH